MPAKNKILYVSSLSGFCGGVERYIYDTAGLLARSGFEVCGLFENTGRDAAEFNQIFNRVYVPADLAEINSSDFDVAFVHKTDNLELLRAVRQKFRTIVFVHDHDYYCVRRHKYFPICRINCHLPANKIYCTLCGGLIAKQQGKIKIGNTGDKFALMDEIRKCDRHLVMSEFMRNNLTMNGFAAEKICKIYPFRQKSLDFPEVSSVSDVVKILYVGQLVRGKGVDLLLRAVRLLDIPFQLDIVGANNDEMMLRQMSVSLGLGEKINFAGWHSSPERFFAAADIFAFSSRWQEPFGLTGIEAFTYGVPVVAFDVGGVTEWLHNRENGLLVKEHDIAEFAAALKILAQNRQLAKTMGNQGQAMVLRDYSPEQFIDNFKAVMAAVCG
jgi:glycosyltransferase involved in cell wall biosynthesis